MDNNYSKIRKLMDEYERSFYIYDEKIIERQTNNLLENFPDFEFLYSIKTNPFSPIVEYVASKGFGADAASAEEVMISQRAGLPYEKILYSTPGKTRKDIEKTIDKAIIIADSYNELTLINEVCKEKNIITKVGLRINADFSMDGGQGVSSKFGVDEESLLEKQEFINNLSNIKISGIHVHLRSQVLDYEKLYNYYKKVFELALFCEDKLGFKLDFINFGGGLGVVYSKENENPLDIEKLSKKTEDLIKEFKTKLDARLIIETGRYVICEAGKYVTYIVDIKESKGIKYLVVEKGLNGFIRPSISEMLMDYMPEEEFIKNAEPLFTRRDAFEFILPEGDLKNQEEVIVGGSLCTAIDVMAKNILLPKSEIGDLFIVTNAGSYSYSLSPLLFASHPSSLQIYVKSNGEIFAK